MGVLSASSFLVSCPAITSALQSFGHAPAISTMTTNSSATPVLMAWRAMNTFGWGIVGLNLFCHWGVSGRIRPRMAAPISEGDLLALGPLRRQLLAEEVAESNALAQRLAAVGSGAVS